jgi:hypothetical protein
MIPRGYKNHTQPLASAGASVSSVGAGVLARAGLSRT